MDQFTIRNEFFSLSCELIARNETNPRNLVFDEIFNGFDIMIGLSFISFNEKRVFDREIRHHVVKEGDVFYRGS